MKVQIFSSEIPGNAGSRLREMEITKLQQKVNDFLENNPSANDVIWTQSSAMDSLDRPTTHLTAIISYS